MSDRLTNVRRRMLKSIGVDLDQPYFVIESRWMKMGQQKCTHENVGVRLDEVDRRCYCRGCGIRIDPFDALLHYAASETRLVRHADAIKQHERAEAARKAAEKARRPFARAVTGFTAVKDMRLKDEPIVGYELNLECGHVAECGPNRKPKRVTCRICHALTAQPARPIKP